MVMDMAETAEAIREAIAEGEVLRGRQLKVIARMRRHRLDAGEATTMLLKTTAMVAEARAALASIEEAIACFRAMPASFC
jgi:hypothetical protein